MKVGRPKCTELLIANGIRELPFGRHTLELTTAAHIPAIMGLQSSCQLNCFNFLLNHLLERFQAFKYSKYLPAIKMAQTIPEKMLAAQVVEVLPLSTPQTTISVQFTNQSQVQQTLQDSRSPYARKRPLRV